MSKNYNRIHSYNFIYFNYEDDFIETEEMLRQIPMDASVTASTFIAPHLIKRENVYAVDMDEYNYFDYPADYLIIDLRTVDIEDYKYFLREIDEYGYKKIDSGVFIEIFKKAEDGGG